MIIKKCVASIPLITCDPYFSVWSNADALNEKDTVHWTGRTQQLKGIVSVDDKDYGFMGITGLENAKQLSIDINPTSTVYEFKAGSIKLFVRFTTPLILSDPELVSRPVTYVDFKASSLDSDVHNVKVTITADENHCHISDEACDMFGNKYLRSGFSAAWMGKIKQSPLCHSGDQITIDWGYMYIAVPKGLGDVSINPGDRYTISGMVEFTTDTKRDVFMMLAYDDTAAINYFGTIKKAYWAEKGATILDILEKATNEHSSLILRCDLLDESLMRKAENIAGEDYALLCALSYRQSIAAHKLIADENGDLVFLSKENNSNGCIGTVDVSYPSIPLYLIYNTDYIKGMLRPVFKFASFPVWRYDFAPHDVGRYPYATGQVYASILKKNKFAADGVYPPYYIMGQEEEVYDFRYQMPVEESGNMLIMCAAVALRDGNADFSKPYMDTLQTWVSYLLKYGEDPEDQLCTDDFAGHLAHNVNLSAKAIMGIASFGIILDMLGRESEAKMYSEKAALLAARWEERAGKGDHTVLSFGDDDSWSLKYNTVWDIFFDTELFSDSFFMNEIKWYIKCSNKYGVPLDSRKAYTKSDWILWCAAFASTKEERKALISPIAEYLYDSPDRDPFGDWYDTETAARIHFRNRTVQGGIFMPILIDEQF